MMLRYFLIILATFCADNLQMGEARHISKLSTSAELGSNVTHMMIARRNYINTCCGHTYCRYFNRQNPGEGNDPAYIYWHMKTTPLFVTLNPKGLYHDFWAEKSTTPLWRIFIPFTKKKKKVSTVKKRKSTTAMYEYEDETEAVTTGVSQPASVITTASASNTALPPVTAVPPVTAAPVVTTVASVALGTTVASQVTTVCAPECNICPKTSVTIFKPDGKIKNELITAKESIYASCGSTFLIGFSPLNQKDANARCCALGMQLVSIETGARLQCFVSAILNGINDLTNEQLANFWTSGKDKGCSSNTKRSFKWCAIDKPFTDTFWNPGTPESSVTSTRNCVVYDATKLSNLNVILTRQAPDGGMTDVSCDNKHNYACEAVFVAG